MSPIRPRRLRPRDRAASGHEPAQRTQQQRGAGVWPGCLSLTTLIAHAADGRLHSTLPLSMSFFFRRLPRARRFVVATGLRSIVEHCSGLRLSHDELATLDSHPILGPALLPLRGGRCVRRWRRSTALSATSTRCRKARWPSPVRRWIAGVSRS